MNNDTLVVQDTKINTLLIQLKRSLVITKKDLKIYYNKPPVLIQGIFFPIILYIALTIGRNIPSLYLVSGLMAMTIFLTSTSIGPIVFPWETMSKTFERVITCPISIKTILLGSLWSSFIFGFLFSLIPLILGMIFLSQQLIYGKGDDMESVYKVIEIIGTSPTSWEEAARNAVETAAKSLSDLRVAEIVEFDMRVEEEKVVAYRAKVKVSFKFKD